MKPNRISAQWVGALILPLAGLLLAGCGGSNDGAKSGANLTQYTFSVAGTAYLEREPATRGLASGDIRLGGATYRVLRRTASSTHIHQTGTTDPDGSYSLAVDVPVGAAQTISGNRDLRPGAYPRASGRVVANVLLLGTLVPGPGALLHRDTSSPRPRQVTWRRCRAGGPVTDHARPDQHPGAAGRGAAHTWPRIDSGPPLCRDLTSRCPTRHMPPWSAA